MLVLTPLAAAVIQLAISRTREYMADFTGGQLSGDPDAWQTPGKDRRVFQFGARIEPYGRPVAQGDGHALPLGAVMAIMSRVRCSRILSAR